MIISGNVAYNVDDEGNLIEEPYRPEEGCVWKHLCMCRGCPVCSYPDEDEEEEMEYYSHEEPINDEENASDNEPTDDHTAKKEIKYYLYAETIGDEEDVIDNELVDVCTANSIDECLEETGWNNDAAKKNERYYIMEDAGGLSEPVYYYF